MKLTSSQKAFLESLRERRLDGQWAWCECFKDEWRTAKSLERRGLVEIMPGDVAEADFFEARLIEATEGKAEMSYEDLYNFARKLALALANEVAFSGEDASKLSLALLSQARKRLGLESAFDEIDSLAK